MKARTRDDQPYTVAEAAELLRVGKSTLYDGIERGDVPHTPIGRRKLIPAHFVQNALNPPQAAAVNALS